MRKFSTSTHFKNFALRPRCASSLIQFSNNFLSVFTLLLKLRRLFSQPWTRSLCFNWQAIHFDVRDEIVFVGFRDEIAQIIKNTFYEFSLFFVLLQIHFRRKRILFFFSVASKRPRCSSLECSQTNEKLFHNCIIV